MSDPMPPAPTGLDSAQARLRLARDGRNELAPPRRRSAWRIVLEVAREPMFQLLLAAGVVYLLLGDRAEALMLLGFVVITASITVVQEQRTERALEALRELSSPHAVVVRDGAALRIPAAEVVVGDLLVLGEGDRVAADAVPLQAHDLQADESLLTGESVPVSKGASPREPAPGDPPARPGAPGLPCVYAGTLLVGGQGLARVVATGARSEVGRIGKSLAGITSPATPLNVQTRRLVRLFSFIGVGLSLVVVALFGLARHDWLGGVLAGITLAMSMLPEEFVLILTVFMAMGAWRLSQQRVLARRAATIETLGAATVLCTDKTGTLTRNHMVVAEIAAWPPGAAARWAVGDAAPAAAVQAVAEFGVLASEPEPVDPMDRALHEWGRTMLPQAGAHPGWALVHEYGLVPALMAMSHVWRVPGQARHTVAVKGAVEALTVLCRLDPAGAAALAAQAQDMAGRGLRVLAVASATHEGTAWPETPRGFGWQLRGLVGLADPLRAGVPEAVRECREAGIRVVMITGDHPATALAIARQAGIDTPAAVVTGSDLAALDPPSLQRAVAGCNVFARVLPEQKLLIVQALRAQGAVVAMTGDGVNDAPSLKAAHIGIAMGGRGTDVAREASSLVLLDDDFGAIVKAVRMGRRIYDNLGKAMAFVLAVHVPIAGLSLLPLLLGWPLIFSPVHIAFLELLIDPVCSIAFEAEAEERDIMQRPPRPVDEPLFSAGMIGWNLALGGAVLAAVAAFHAVLLAAAVPEAQARAATFTALVCSNFGLILVSRSRGGPWWRRPVQPNPVLWRTLGAAALLLTLVLLVPAATALFHFAPLGGTLAGAALAVAAAVLVSLTGLQLLAQRRHQPARAAS